PAGASPTSPGDSFAFTADADAVAGPAPAAAMPTAGGAPRVPTCRRMPRLTGHTLAQARRTLARADCSVHVKVTGRGARRGHRTITSQTPKAGRSLYAGDRTPTVRFG
ncbi:MAG: hypothetical protein JWP17_3435, partial [Solirubrobacterales bacterium]|nr:hypothetical protein [Solirubrobacterales bacterium]